MFNILPCRNAILNLSTNRSSLTLHRRCFAYCSHREQQSGAYAGTRDNLIVTAETRVIFQGFTGRQATFDAKQSLEYGTKIVGGVRPGKDGEHLGLPVLPSVREVSDLTAHLGQAQSRVLSLPGVK